MKARYTLGWVAGESVPTSFIGELIAVLAVDQPELCWTRCGPVLYLGRSLVAQMFLEQREARQTPSLVMVDTDIIFGPSDVAKLFEHPEPVVSGVYVDSEADLVTEGCGFLRIDRIVLEELGVRCFDPIPTSDGMMTGEDVAFRHRVKEAGFSICVDPAIRVGHVKQVMLWPDGSEQPQSNAAVKIIGRPVPMAPPREEIVKEEEARDGDDEPVQQLR